MIRGLLIFATLLVASYSLTNKQQFANKIINVGFKLMDNATIRKICTCMETPVFQLKPVTDLISDGQTCALSNAGNLYGPVMTLYTQMESCLSPVKSDLVSLIMKLTTAQTVVGPKLMQSFTTLFEKIQMWKEKKPKLTKDQVINNMYGFGIKQFNKTVINQYCNQLLKSGAITKAEWKCVLQYGKTVVDFTPYGCAKNTPAN